MKKLFHVNTKQLVGVVMLLLDKVGFKAKKRKH